MLGSLCIQPLQKSALGTLPMVADGTFMAAAPSGRGEWMVFCESDSSCMAALFKENESIRPSDMDRTHGFRFYEKRCPCGQEHKLYKGGMPEKWCRQDLVAGASKDQKGTSSAIIISPHIFMSICILAPGGAPCWGGYGKFSGAFLANVGAGSYVLGIHFLLFWGSRNPDHLKESMNITPDGQILHPKKGQELVRLNPEVNHFCSKSRNRYAGITVQSLSVASIGSVIQAGQTVTTVIPGDTPLVLEADLPSQDIGFVKVGQKTHKSSSPPTHSSRMEKSPARRFGSVLTRRRQLTASASCR